MKTVSFICMLRSAYACVHEILKPKHTWIARAFAHFIIKSTNKNSRTYRHRGNKIIRRIDRQAQTQMHALRARPYHIDIDTVDSSHYSSSVHASRNQFFLYSLICSYSPIKMVDKSPHRFLLFTAFIFVASVVVVVVRTRIVYTQRIT